MRTYVTVFSVLFGITAVGIILWFAFFSNGNNYLSPQFDFLKSSSAFNAEDVLGNGSVDGVTYENREYGFSLMHPSELIVSTYDEAAGATTISFETQSGDHGFQIFILPYRESQITQSRIDKDTRGTATEPQEIIVGGNIRALMFESRNPIFGTLREVWFLHEGYLYEVTTYIDLDEELAEIMGTWRFLDGA